MFLQILRPLEALATEIALVGLQGNMDTDMRSDVISLDSGCSTLIPLACQVQVVGALATNVLLADVFLRTVSFALMVIWSYGHHAHDPYSVLHRGSRQW